MTLQEYAELIEKEMSHLPSFLKDAILTAKIDAVKIGQMASDTLIKGGHLPAVIPDGAAPILEEELRIAFAPRRAYLQTLDKTAPTYRVHLYAATESALRDAWIKTERRLTEQGAPRTATQQSLPDPRLSHRENEILELVNNGLNRQEIAAKLLIEKRTVDSNIKSISIKLDFPENVTSITKLRKMLMKKK